MEKTRTVEANGNGAARFLIFPGTKISEFGRVDTSSAGWIKWKCNPGPNLKAICQAMGWVIPGHKTTMERLEGKLKGGSFILTSKDKLSDAEIDIEFKETKGFELHRLELKGRGRKGEGFRHELRFNSSFECEDGAANLESYMMRTDNAKGQLKITYYPEAVQTELPMQGEEARQAALPAAD